MHRQPPATIPDRCRACGQSETTRASYGPPVDRVRCLRGFDLLPDCARHTPRNDAAIGSR